MKKDGLLSEILNAVVSHERKKAKSDLENPLTQKKRLWYGLMNQIDPEEGETDEEKEK